MLVKLKTISAGLSWGGAPGSIIDVEREIAMQLCNSGQAECVEAVVTDELPSFILTNEAVVNLSGLADEVRNIR